MNYINNLEEINNNAKFNVSFDGKGTFKFYVDPFMKSENIEYTIHIFNSTNYIPYNKRYSQEVIGNFGEITINHTFSYNSSNIFEYKYNFGKIDISFNYFVIIGHELKSGYIYFYDEKDYYYSYESESDNKKWIWIIVGLAIGLVIIFLIICFIIRRKKGNKFENIESNIQGELMEKY